MRLIQAVLGCWVLSAIFATPVLAARPNILVLLADDVGWKDFGCYGNPAIRTPQIDRLAQEGLLFQNCFLTTSQCSPTRISVLTGKYPHATGAEDLHVPLPPGQVFVSTYLQRAGYFTGHMLKTHYGPNGIRQFQWYSNRLADFPKFLDKAGGRPFFLWVGFHDAHRPYQPGAVEPPHRAEDVIVPPFMADTPETRADLALYYDEVSRMDGHIGEMVDTLKSRGLLENTCIVFFSDNGRPFPRCKGTVYDSGIGTPLIFHWPAKIGAGQVHEGLASVVDLAPTFLELAEADVPGEMQGHSMAPVLGDPSRGGRDYIFAERNWHNCDEHIRCVRSPRYRLIHNAYVELPFGSPRDVSKSASWLSLKRLKDRGELRPEQALLFQAPRPVIELYDLKNDPDELTNVADKPRYQNVVRDLSAVLERWENTTGDFPPERRRRGDDTDRYTGKKTAKKTSGRIPPLVE